MSDLWQTMCDFKEAIAILTLIDEGDEVAPGRIHDLLKRVRARARQHEEARNAKQARREKRMKTGRRNSGLFDIAPRFDKGSDWSADGIVLAVNANGVRLVWRYGGKYWGDQLRGYVYGGVGLDILYPDLPNRSSRDYESLLKAAEHSIHARGRLTAKLIMEHAARIDEVFGSGTAVEVAKLKGTVRT